MNDGEGGRRHGSLATLGQILGGSEGVRRRVRSERPRALEHTKCVLHRESEFRLEAAKVNETSVGGPLRTEAKQSPASTHISNDG